MSELSVTPAKRFRGRSFLGTLLVVALMLLAVAWPALRDDPAPAPIGSATGAASFRGGPERTGSMPGPGPVSRVRLLWRVPTGQIRYASPVVGGDLVYVAAGGRAFAIGRLSGRIVWRVETDDDLATPVVAGDLVILGGQDVSALEGATGRERWSFAAAGGVWSAAAVVDGVVYVASTGVIEGGGEDEGARLHALAAGDGEPIWETPFGGYRSSAPTVVDGVVYVHADDGNLYAFDAATGQERWRQAIGAYETLPGGAAVAEGTLFVVGRAPVAKEEGDGETTAVLLALEAATGQERWRFAVRGEGLILGPSPAVAAGAVFVSGGDRLYALDAATGQERWRLLTDGNAGDPTVAGGVVFLTTGSGGAVLAADARTGAELWRIQTIEVFPTNPVVVDGVVYLACYNFDAEDGFVYAIGGSIDPPETASPAATPDLAFPTAHLR